MAGVHEPVRWNGTGLCSNQIAPPVQQARCYHYYLRSREDAHRKARQWGKEDPVRMLESGQHAPADDAGRAVPASGAGQPIRCNPRPARDPDRRKATSAPTPTRPYRTRAPSRAADVTVAAERCRPATSSRSGGPCAAPGRESPEWGGWLRGRSSATPVRRRRSASRPGSAQPGKDWARPQAPAES